MDNGSKTLLKGLLGVLTFAFSNEHVLNAKEANNMLLVGVIGVLTLVFSSEQLFNACQEVATKKYMVNEGLMSDSGSYENTLKLLQSPYQQQNIPSPLSRLTRRETDVLGFMIEGLMNKEIATRLQLSEATVKNHVTSILRKLNATVRTEAVVTAIRCGFYNKNNNMDMNAQISA